MRPAGEHDQGYIAQGVVTQRGARGFDCSLELTLSAAEASEAQGAPEARLGLLGRVGGVHRQGKRRLMAVRSARRTHPPGTRARARASRRRRRRRRRRRLVHAPVLVLAGAVDHDHAGNLAGVVEGEQPDRGPPAEWPTST